MRLKNQLLPNLLLFIIFISLAACNQNKAEKTPVANQTDESTEGPDVETALRARRLFIYRLRSNLTYGNLSMAPGEGWAFWDRLDKEPDLREELRRARYAGARAAANADGDHSFARALGQAVRDRLAKLPAIRVTSARTDAATTGLESGDNLVFFGGDGTRIDVLGPFREVTFAAWSGGKIGQVIRAL